MKTKEFFSFILMLLGVATLAFFLPWWAPVIWIILLAVVMKISTRSSIIYGGLSMAIVWTGMALWMSEKDAAGIISKTGELMGGISPLAMILITLLIGIITGVLSGWFGSRLGNYIHQHPK